MATNTKQVQKQRPSAWRPENRHGGEDAMQIVKTLDSMIAALKEARDSKNQSLARRKECARTLTEGIAALKKYVNDSEARHEAIFFWVDENEVTICPENKNEQAEGYLQIEPRRGDDRGTIITLSPSEIRELRLALQAEEGDRRKREKRVPRVSRPSRPMRAKRNMREIKRRAGRANRQSRQTSRAKKDGTKNAAN